MICIPCFFSDLIYQLPLICPILITLAFLSKPRTVLIRLCICFFFCLECSPSYALALFSYFLQIFSKVTFFMSLFLTSLSKTARCQAPLCPLPASLPPLYISPLNIPSICFIYFAGMLPAATHTLECKLQDSGTYICSVLSTAIS